MNNAASVYTCGNPQCCGPIPHDQITGAIERHGQFVVAVYAGDDTFPFAYTIGRHQRGLPELLAVMEHDRQIPEAGHFLNFLGQRDVQPGHTIESGLGKYIAKDVSESAEVREYVAQADHYYGADVAVLCVMSPCNGEVVM